MAEKIRAYLEVGDKRTFASAADWPGWSRSGKDPHSCIETLAAYAPRYEKVADLAGFDLPLEADYEVIEKIKGNATTDFGAPGVPMKDEFKPRTKAQIEREIALLEACWKYLDQVRAEVPEELRKGPRGGGRDREKMYQHVVDAEMGYAPAIGLKMKTHDRKALLEALRHPAKDTKWPVTYAIRRIAWHALDHAWEMEDRIP